jgi:hypothetical protein
VAIDELVTEALRLAPEARIDEKYQKGECQMQYLVTMKLVDIGPLLSPQ